jgi:hypothetical protein
MRNKPAGVQRARRGSDESPYSELLTQKLFDWLNYGSTFFGGMQAIASRLGLPVPQLEGKKYESYTNAFVAEFVRWYYTDEGEEDQEKDIHAKERKQ